MTTKPKARKFRIRRSDGTTPPPADGSGADAPQTAPEDLLAAPDTPEDGFGDMAMPGSPASDRQKKAAMARAAMERAANQAPKPGAAGTEAAPSSSPAARPSGAPAPTGEQDIAAIRAEGLTGRQLRMARRTAQKHGLSPTSDFDAVRLLRERGIDPFAQSNMLELVVDAQSQRTAEAPSNLPAPAAPAGVPAAPQRPQPLNAEERAAEIISVQRDIARRRRKRLVLLVTRLSFFVLLPTLLVSYYYYFVATPLYATNTEFVIQQAETGVSSGGGGGLGGLLGGSSFATVQESIIVQSYLESREAMLRLNEDLDFRAHFSDEHIDPLIRLDAEATVEQVYDLYRQQLTIGYDPTEGVIKMEFAAADPVTSQSFAEALVTYAEERVDQMSQRLREDGMAGARESFEDAEARVLEAQARVLSLQETRGVLSAEAEVSAVFNQIGTFELELQQERLRLAEIQAARSPNATRVRVAQDNISRLEALITELRSGLIAAETGQASLARIQSELVIAQADLETRQMMLAQALQQMESARIEANRQSLYLSMGVFPVAPDEAAYPRAFENTLLAFLIFSGIYLMVSMTAAILKEQISS